MTTLTTPSEGGETSDIARSGSSFSYEALEEGVASNLRLQAARIKQRIGKATQDLIDIGRDLEAAKQHLERGQFTSWVESELGLSIRSAQNYMTMAKLADEQGETVSLLSPRSVQRLAAKSIPAKIVQQVLARARSGDVPQEGVIARMIFGANQEKRIAELEAKRANRRARMSKKRREALAAEERERQARRQAKEQARKEQAADIVRNLFERLDADGIALVKQMFADDVMWEVHSLLNSKLKRAA